MAIKKRSATVVPGASGAAAAVKNPQASKSSFWGELPQHVMSGISRMVPTLIMGGVISLSASLLLIAGLKFLLISASWMLLIAGNSPVSTFPY